ncbi:hypothetical protein V8E36_003437 [Tilletia maclaganii]
MPVDAVHEQALEMNVKAHAQAEAAARLDMVPDSQGGSETGAGDNEDWISDADRTAVSTMAVYMSRSWVKAKAWTDVVPDSEDEGGGNEGGVGDIFRSSYTTASSADHMKVLLGALVEAQCLQIHQARDPSISTRNANKATGTDRLARVLAATRAEPTLFAPLPAPLSAVTTVTSSATTPAIGSPATPTHQRQPQTAPLPVISGPRAGTCTQPTTMGAPTSSSNPPYS